MKKIKLANKLQLKLAGKPGQTLSVIPPGTDIGVMPAMIHQVKPRLLVAPGDRVQIGSPLFEDKANGGLQFRSTAAGHIADIVYGAKRCISLIRITRDSTDALPLPTLNAEQITASSPDQIARILQANGMWIYFREFPYNVIPRLDHRPPAIYISLENLEPFMPEAEVFLPRQKEAFLHGLAILKQLSQNQLFIAFRNGHSLPFVELKPYLTHEITGPYPATQADVVLYHTKTSKQENHAWTISAQDVSLLGQTCLTGTFAQERIIVIAGSAAKTPRHAAITIGTSISAITGDASEVLHAQNLRCLAGGVFQGQLRNPADYFNYFDHALHLLPAEKPLELLPFMQIGVKKQSVFRTYLSAFLPQREIQTTSAKYGGVRSCISCGKCHTVCPVDLIPELLVKLHFGGDLDECLRMGVLDCVGCGLCTYVCPSKIDLDAQFTEIKSQLYKETLA